MALLLDGAFCISRETQFKIAGRVFYLTLVFLEISYYFLNLLALSFKRFVAKYIIHILCLLLQVLKCRYEIAVFIFLFFHRQD